MGGQLRWRRLNPTHRSKRPAGRTEMKELSEFERVVARLDAQLKPVANRTYDFNDPGWIAQLANTPDPLDETGLRVEMETLLVEITDHYATCDHETRQAIRSLFEKHASASWAASFSRAPTTIEGVRRQLLIFSVLDQGRDTRDAILWLQDIVARARSAGIQIEAMLEEVAGYSSETNKFGMGSTKGLLLKSARK
jgi:hypothetical protein